jgi:cellulose biosynthesis protein BcsQ
MVHKIALFNHKGGVSKTTTTFNIGWMLAKKGKKVVMVDADPQCNLTGMVLGYRGDNEFRNFYNTHENQNIKGGLAPAFESQPRPIEAVDCIQVPHRNNLYLLPGHIGLAEYEVTLGIAQELSGTIVTLKNLPGSFTTLLNKTAEHHNADYILIDMSPSLSSINQNLLMTSDFFIVPTAPDFFSVMALNSLDTILSKWVHWAQKARSLPILQQAEYPFPNVHPKFLGTIIQKFRPRSGAPSIGFQEWIDEINQTVRQTIVPNLSQYDMMLSDTIYREYGLSTDYCLAQISDFNTLIAKSQKYQVPVFDLTDRQLGYTGQVLQQARRPRDKFAELFSDLAKKIIGITQHADRL